MKKKFRHSVLVLVAALAVSSVVGCTSKEKDEETIRTAITDELDSIKNQDEDLMQEYEQSLGDAGLEDIGVDVGQFLSVYLNGFDYRIEEINVEEEKASASVVLKCKRFSEYGGQFEEAAQSLLEDTEALSQLSEEELRTKVGELAMEALSELELKETDPITVEYELVDNVWTPTEESQDAVANAMFVN